MAKKQTFTSKLSKQGSNFKYVKHIKSVKSEDTGHIKFLENMDRLEENENLYQAFTGVNALHLNEAYIKSIAIGFNTFLNYFFGVLFSFIYWTKFPKLDIYIIPKVIFLLVYFGLYAFLSQNNPGGAVRYMSSVIPILVTYLFIIIPKRRMS